MLNVNKFLWIYFILLRDFIINMEANKSQHEEIADFVATKFNKEFAFLQELASIPNLLPALSK